MSKKILQVFDWLKMPEDIKDDLAAFFEATDGSYHRWYPDEHWTYPGEELKHKVNQWLLEQNMTVDESDKYFHVLIYISW